MNYPGEELDLFQHATFWKSYYGGFLKPHLSGDVLEVGGGIGATTPYLMNPSIGSYTILEPDPQLFSAMEKNLATHPLRQRMHLINGITDSLDQKSGFDALLYIDVLEHIEKDYDELIRADRLLRPGGRLIVLCPAFRLLWSPFDEAVGHFRRYTRNTLKKVFPKSYTVIADRYFDSLGAGLSLANRLFSRASIPSRSQIDFWNRYVLPASKWTDPLLHPFWGRSVLVVARKPIVAED